MKRSSLYLSMLLVFFLPVDAQPATEVFQVSFIPLQEAKAAAVTQLSPQGNVVSMPSQRQLIVMDDADAIERVRRLLSRIDMMTPQFSATVEISSHRREQDSGISVEAVLPGGWVRISARNSLQQSISSQVYNLRIQGGKSGSIEAGQVVSVQQGVRAWLTGLGVLIEQQSVLTSVTGGFDIHIQATGEQHAIISIHPWLKQLNTQAAGNAATRIDIAEADTELIIPLGQTVTIASAGGDAKKLSTALIAAGSNSSEPQLQFQVKVDAVR